jgi:hypothetical protein
MPRLPTALAFLAVCALAAPLVADDDAAAQEFRRAELAETSFGDLAHAADLYRSAADKSSDKAFASRAALRAGSCLLRLGKADDAKALLAPLADGDGVPEDVRRAAKAQLAAASIAAPAPRAPEPGPAADRKKLEETEHDRDTLRAQLDAALQREQGLTRETEKLSQEVRQKDKEIGAMRARIEPTSAEELLRARIEERERRHRADAELSRSYASLARRFHQEGRFAEARDWANVALEKDPENAEAKALVTLVSAPLGARERLYESVLGSLALSHEVRGARTAAEIGTLVAEAKRRQERQEFGPSVAPLERALALIDAGAAYLRDSDATRDDVLRMLRAAQAHGAQRSPAPPSAPSDDAEARGLAAVRDLLSSAGNEVVRGLELRFHDVGPALSAAAAGLPPAPVAAPPEAWTISAQADAAAPLVALYLRACDATAFAAPGAAISAAGSDVVALCDAEAQARLTEEIAGLADVTAPAAELRVTAYRLEPGDFGALLESRGIRVRQEGGARVAAVAAADLDAIAPDLGKRAKVWPSVAALRATTLRPFRLTAGTAAASLAVDLLPVTRPRAGVAVRVTTTWAPGGRSDGAALRQEAEAASLLGAGGGLVLFGIADPGDPTRDLAVVVREGVAPPAPSPSPPPPAQGLSASEIQLPASLRGLVEVGPEAVLVPGHLVASRRDALKARLRAVAAPATVEVDEDRVLVVGSDEARAAARKLVDQIDVVRGVQAFDVAVYEVTPTIEKSLLADVPHMERHPGETFPRAIVRADARKYVEQALAGTTLTKRRLPLAESRISAPPTGRADAAYVVRSAYRRDLEIAPGREVSWGRSETDLADEGVLVAVRPFGRGDTGRASVDVSLRASWIADRGETTHDTPLGRVTTLAPVPDAWWDDFSAPLADEELLLVAGMKSPFADGGDRTRLVVTLANARP